MPTLLRLLLMTALFSASAVQAVILDDADKEPPKPAVKPKPREKSSAEQEVERLKRELAAVKRKQSQNDDAPEASTGNGLEPGNLTVSRSGAIGNNQDNEKERFQLAYDALRNSHTHEAIKLFEVLLTDYPAGELSHKAQYWLGEAYNINGDFDKASAAFNMVVIKYSNSPFVPDALLKLGFIEFKRQNPVKAREFFNHVQTNYPETTAARLAAQKLAKMTE